jgi:hypothetical protein
MVDVDPNTAREQTQERPCSRTRFDLAEVLELLKRVHAQGRKQGFHEGWTAGRRKAKGLKNPAKKPGRPPAIDADMRVLLIDHVNKREGGQSARDAVIAFIRRWQVGSYLLLADRSIDWDAVDPSTPALKAALFVTPANLNTALRAYYRRPPAPA